MLAAVHEEPLLRRPAAARAAGFGAVEFWWPFATPVPADSEVDAFADDAVAVVRRARAAGAPNVGFLCDLYHLASNGDDIDAAIAAHTDLTAHVQIADAPGRGEPGSGQLDLDRYLSALEDHGYRGWVSLEYKPTSTTEASLAWLPRRTPCRSLDEKEGAAMSTRIAFIGLGIMGAPMAANLVKAGFDVTGYNRSPARVEQLVAAGGRGAKDIAEAVREADVVATMVPDSPDVQAVLAGEGGVFEHAPSDALIIDFSSIRPDVATALAAEAAERGFRMLDAPVSGGEQGAIEGVLSIMVGGAAAAFEAAGPVFGAVGKTIVHVGPSGSGQTVKAANQLMVAGQLELLAEAIIFLEAYGVDTEAALRVLGGGLAGSTVIQRKGAAMLARDFTPGFRIALHDKDMGIVTAAAREAGVVIPLGAVAAQLVSSLKAQGDGGLDHSALLKLVAQLSGRD